MIQSNFTKLKFLNNVLIKSSVVPTPILNSNTILLKGGSGATNHYVTKKAITMLDKIILNESIHVTLPNDQQLTSTHTGELNIPQLSIIAKQAHILPVLHNTSLLSL